VKLALMALTRRQREVFDFVRGFVAEHGYSPSLEEIGAAFGLTSVATVHKHVQHLVEKGYLRKAWNRSRSVEPAEEAERATVALPLLGTVAAGAIWLGLSGWPLIALWLGRPETAREIGLDVMVLKALGGLLPAASAMLFMHAQFVLTFGFSMIVLLILLRLLTRRTWIAVTIWVPLSVFVLDAPAKDVVLFLALGTVTLTVFFRLGVLGLMVVLGLSGLQVPLPAALSTSAWYAGPTWLFLAVFTVVAVYGFTVSLGGRSAFGRILAEE